MSGSARAMLCAMFVAGCAPSAKPTTDAGGSASPDAGVPGVQFLSRLAGLWSGPASMTPLGNLKALNMDMRPATPDILFGRQDVDASDSLRFEILVETFNGASTLVFRNGGYFMGILRDTRTALQSADDTAGTWHFCAEQGGCGYVDVVFQFAGATQLTMTVHVNGALHVIWTASLVETRTIPSTFPATQAPQDDGDAGFPVLGQLTATVSWTQPLAATTSVWVILTTTPCSLTGGGCNMSRLLTFNAAAGATSATLVFEQLLPGTYDATAVLDNDGDFATTLFPQPGDGVSDPNQSITTPASGNVNASLPIVATL